MSRANASRFRDMPYFRLSRPLIGRSGAHTGGSLAESDHIYGQTNWPIMSPRGPARCDNNALPAARVSTSPPAMYSPSRFVVTASQRTGSTLLVRSLDTSADIFCAGEIFHAGPGTYHPEYQFPYRLLGSRRLARIRDRMLRNRAEAHLRSFYDRAGAGVKAVGFKLMLTHADEHPAVVPYLQACGAVFFFLYRKDSFATAISYYKARESGVYHSDRTDRQSSGPTIRADVRKFERLLMACRSDKERLISMQSTLGGHLLAYEDMIGSWNHFVGTLGRDIGVPGLDVQKSLSRLESGTRTVTIANEDELRLRFPET